MLAAVAGTPLTSVGTLRDAWRQRRASRPAYPRVIDTRYDVGHLLSGTSRRLVDVCSELRLDVTQPELRGAPHTVRTLSPRKR